MVVQPKVAPRPCPPEGVLDFDLENMEDPQQHSGGLPAFLEELLLLTPTPEYAMQTFQYYKTREEAFKVPNYIEVSLWTAA